ncbi:MAG TPA: PAS domain S-box protein [Acidobacteriaceae bacterium]|nr:PAS domain S-box protein [Acidobacteriaceae bacterium]
MGNDSRDREEEVRRLQRCVNDLVSVLALPAVWSKGEPRRILKTILDALLEMLDLDFLYGRTRLDAGDEPIEMLGVAPSSAIAAGPEGIRQALRAWFGQDPHAWPGEMRRGLGDAEVSIVPLVLGIGGELGLLVAGTRRAGFPEDTERLILTVAANQTAIGLQQAQRLREQERVAEELDRRVAERTRELEQANEELRLQVGLLQHLPVSAWTLHPDGTPNFVNQVWLEFSGQPVDFVRSHPEAWMTAIHPEDREAASKAFWDGVHSGRGFAFETRSLRARDQTWRWHLQQAVALRDSEGKVLRFVGTTTDIDDQKRAEEAVRASEAKLWRVIDTIPTLTWCNLPDGPNEFLSRSWHEYTGLSPEEAHGWGWSVSFHPDDLPPLMARWQQMLVSGEPGEIEARIRRFDGVYRWFLIRASPYRDETGAILRWYGTSTDIDDRKRAEEELKRSEARYRVVVETASDAVISIDEGGRIILANPATKRIFGHNPEDLIGRPLTVLMPQAMRALHETGYQRYLETGTRRLNWQGTEMSALRANGKEFPAEISFGEMTADGGKIFTGFIRDLSEKKRSEEALNKARTELAHVSRVTSLSAFTASIAHEINQPLSGIVTNASTCLRMLDAEPPNVSGARETARRALRDSHRLSDVITRLRALFTRKEVKTEPVDINELAREVIALYLAELERNHVSLRLEFAEGLPSVMGDRIQLQQVILNLVRNASDAMSAVKDRPRELVVSTEPAGKEVCFKVRDAGIGIDPTASERLFESFYTTKEDGMGMGLSVSRSIIEAHEGRLWAMANDGPGATFAFSVPCTWTPQTVARRPSL